VWGLSATDLIREETLADVFESTARRVPDMGAVCWTCGGQEWKLTYGELNAWADAASTLLAADGIGPGDVVGLWLTRGPALLAMQLAIAKTGAAWLPFDAQTPRARVQRCLEDSRARGIVVDAVLCQEKEWFDAVRNGSTRTDIATETTRVWMAEAVSERASPHLGSVPRRRATPDDPAYVIYTSGSTGLPKGIVVSQRSICHFLRSENLLLGVREGDLVAQGFSVAFDMSFEEIWISYLVGATLWLVPENIAADPQALPAALNAAGVTVLHAVPTLLSLFEDDVPSLRLVNLGGEACPDSLVRRWARSGRAIFNTYGPTETTVSASAAELRPGDPVTIGSPLPNYSMLVIDHAALPDVRLQAIGIPGELCVAGPGVALGYLGRPELTAERFLPNAWARAPGEERFYRTGDLGLVDAKGRVHCLGRIDDQVKVRGYRVELGEIEAVLTAQSGIGAAAVVLRSESDVDQLVAYVQTGAADVDTVQTWRSALAAALPPYMVPSRFEILSTLPRLSSGKIDRGTLRGLPVPASTGSGPGIAESSEAPRGDVEEALFAEIARLFPHQPLRRDSDFFTDLGGHSLMAARLVSALRAHPACARISVRHVYQNRRLADIAQAVQNDPSCAVSKAVAANTDRGAEACVNRRRWLCGLAQALAVPVLITVRMSQWLAPFFTYHFLTGDPGDSVWWAMLAAVGVFLFSTVAGFVVAWAGKWLIAGRLAAGRYPLWGWTYFRWWLSDRLIEAVPIHLIGGSPLHALWLRALGARIGRDAQLGSCTPRCPDLLRIDDRVSVGNAVIIDNARVEQGQLILGEVHLGPDSYVGSYTVLEGGSRIEASGHLVGQSVLVSGETLPNGRIWGGSPAVDQGAFIPRHPPRPLVSRWLAAWEAASFATGSVIVSVLFFLPVFPALMLIDGLDNDVRWPWLTGDSPVTSVPRYFFLALPACVALVLATALLSAAIRWVCLPRMSEGSWPVHSSLYRRRWLVNLIQESSLDTLHGVYATVFAPWWYRLLGARVGRDAEVSSALGVVPDMLTLGDETFIADAVMLGDEEVDEGWMTVRPTVIGRRTFVGNGALVPDGTTLPDNVLIGVLSTPPAAAEVHEGDTWLGSPALYLPARETLLGFPEHLTFRPGIWRRLARGGIEMVRIVLPHAFVIAVGYTVVLEVMPAAEAGRWPMVAAGLVASGLAFGVASYALVASLKWLLIGRYRSMAAPMWTPFVWLSEAVTNLYESMAVPNLLDYLRGTPFLPVAMRGLGCRIGAGVYLDTTDMTEFDCVTIGDRCEINAHACLQTHLFEDRVMKIDDVILCADVTVGSRTTVLYGAEVEDGARLGPLTLVMKGERIPAGTAWRGLPASPCGSVRCVSGAEE
jgi:non-ribosomal peptide synthetase-like protein